MTVFQKIIDKEIPAAIVYEDQDVLAFLDTAQCTKGHTLVIPKIASKDYFDTDPEVLAKVTKVAQIVGHKLQQSLNPSGINIISNAGEIAGQSVFHFHIHVIPRYGKNDGINIDYTENPDADLQAILKEIG